MEDAYLGLTFEARVVLNREEMGGTPLGRLDALTGNPEKRWWVWLGRQWGGLSPQSHWTRCSQPTVSYPPFPSYTPAPLSKLSSHCSLRNLSLISWPGQSPMTYVFCKGFTVRCLCFSVSLFEYCQPHSLIPVRTEVMSVLHSHCSPHSPTCCRAWNIEGA